MGMNICECSPKSKSLVAGSVSLMFSVTVLFYTLKEMIFESHFISQKVQSDIVVISIVAIIFTVVLIAGIVKESRHLFLPWLFGFGISLCILFLYSLYLIIYSFQRHVLLASILFIVAGFGFYGWITVVVFYSHIKDNETDEDIARRRSQEVVTEIFMRPPPPPYSISYENPLAYEKPPPYDAVLSSEENRY